MRRIYLYLLYVIVLAVMPASVFASGKLDSQSQVSYYDKARYAAAHYVGIVEANTSDWQGSTVKFEFPLYDFYGSVTAYLFSVTVGGTDSGYLIVSADNDPVVLESAREGKHPYFNFLNEGQPIYVGVTMYYFKKNDLEYMDIRKGKIITSMEFKSKGTLQGKYSKKSINLSEHSDLEFSPLSIEPQTIISYSKKIIAGVPDFSWYLGCSPTSFSNIVKYWSNNGYPNLVQSGTTTNQLIKEMAGYMHTKSDGTTGWDDRVTGMVNYWSNKNYKVSVSRVSASFSTHKTEMNNNRPDIINVVNDATYGNHDMTGVGYEEYQDSDQNFKWFRWVIVHDTWDSTPKDVYIYLPQLSWNETVKVVPK